MIDLMPPPPKKQKPSGPEPKKDRHLNKGLFIRLPDLESELLRQLAEKNDRTYTAEIVRALRKHFRDEGLLPSTSEPK